MMNIFLCVTVPLLILTVHCVHFVPLWHPVARWDGVAWTPLPTIVGLGASARAVAQLPNGDLVVGGLFATGSPPFGNLARWNGTAWSVVGGGVDNVVTSLLALPNGDLIVGGAFTRVGNVNQNALGIARWNGSSWSSMGAGFFQGVMGLEAFPNGDLLAMGQFATVAGVATPGLARWNGSAWASAAPGVTGSPRAMTVTDTGIVVAGNPFRVGGQMSAPFLQLAPSCPASTQTLGTGCVGSAGPLQLAGTARAWLGGTFRARATGLTAPSLGLGIVGFAPTSVPLATFLSQGAPGCSLLVTPDLLEAGVAVGGVFATQIAVPDSAALVGQVVYHQVVPIELSGSGAILAFTATNALVVTLGDF